MINRGLLSFLGILSLTVAPVLSQGADMGVRVRHIDLQDFPKVGITVTFASHQELDFRSFGEDHVRLTEEEVPIKSLKVEPVESHLSLGIVVDDSGSMDPELTNLKRALYKLVDYMKPDDEAAVIRFARGVQKITPLTSDKKTLIDGISRMKAYGASALFDALTIGVSEVFRGKGKKAILVITDGRDQAFTGGPQFSSDNMDSVIAMARAHRVEIHAVGLGPRVDHRVLETITRYTGGYYYPSPTPETLISLLDRLGTSLSGAFRITYMSPRPVEDHEIRQVRIWSRFEGHRGSTVLGYRVEDHTETAALSVTREKVHNPDRGGVQVFTYGLRGTHLPLNYYLHDSANEIVRQGVTSPDGYGRLDGIDPDLVNLSPGAYRLEVEVPGTTLRYIHPELAVTAGQTRQYTYRYSKLLFRRNRVIWYDTPHPLGDTSDLVRVKIERLGDSRVAYEGRLIDFKEGRETFAWLEQGEYRVSLDNFWDATPWPDVPRQVLKNRLSADVGSNGSKILFFDVVDSDFIGSKLVLAEREIRPEGASHGYSTTITQLGRTRAKAGTDLLAPGALPENGRPPSTGGGGRVGTPGDGGEAGSPGAGSSGNGGGGNLNSGAGQMQGNPGQGERPAGGATPKPDAGEKNKDDSLLDGDLWSNRMHDLPQPIAKRTVMAQEQLDLAESKDPADRAVSHLKDLAESLQGYGVRSSSLVALAQSLESDVTDATDASDLDVTVSRKARGPEEARIETDYAAPPVIGQNRLQMLLAKIRAKRATSGTEDVDVSPEDTSLKSMESSPVDQGSRRVRSSKPSGVQFGTESLLQAYEEHRDTGAESEKGDSLTSRLKSLVDKRSSYFPTRSSGEVGSDAADPDRDPGEGFDAIDRQSQGSRDQRDSRQGNRVQAANRDLDALRTMSRETSRNKALDSSLHESEAGPRTPTPADLKRAVDPSKIHPMFSDGSDFSRQDPPRGARSENRESAFSMPSSDPVSRPLTSLRSRPSSDSRFRGNMKNARREADSLSEALRAVTIPGSRSAGESGMAPAGEDPVLDDSQPGSSADAESGFRRSRVEILEKPVRYRQSKVAPTGSVNPYASMVESGL